MRETAASLKFLPDTATDRAARHGNASSNRSHSDARKHRPVAQPERDDPRSAGPGAGRIPLDGGRRGCRGDRDRRSPQVTSLRNQLDTPARVPPDGGRGLDHAAKAPGAREVGLRSDSGATLARVVLLPDGAGYLRGDKLERLPADQTYQLWAVTGSETKPTVVSAGVLGPDPSALGFHASGPVRAFAVTVEKAGGVVASRNKPVESREPQA